ncbi:MAG: heme-binding protein [Firmicutes bacterium]|nr:heme-binding protein [Bacillota bacterium]
MKSIDRLLAEVAEKLNVPPSVQNNPVSHLTLVLAKELAYAVECAAEEMGLNVVISVYNEGANPILLHAMDGAFIASVNAAQDKAYTAAALRMPTHVALQKSRGGDFDGLTNGNGILLLGGGYPLEANGKTHGAVGVSGGTKTQDITLAKLAADYFKTRMK